ncbi:MAG TPA: malate/lactate/ureidoglycolate dehydrogenase [Geminicoccaceae bacterium]|nr:malate/lactate/ureidoglycolate dehydrogenase [Geminicoccaceae bacterium]
MSIAADPLHQLVRTIFEHAGTTAEEAQLVADHLVEANLMGHDSHGVIRVQPYVGLLQAGKTKSGQAVRITRDAGALITVDGQEGLGQVVCKQAMDVAIERAREHGVAVLALCNTTHMGRIGAWAEQAAAAGMVSLHFCNTTGFGIQVAPFGGTDRRLSVNPIAMGVPRPGKEPIIHDMSTGTIAAGKIRVARNKGTRLPEGSLIDNQGRPTTDPEAFFTNPPGAITTAAGHKGYGLAFFVEILAGSLTAGGSSHPDNPTADRAINNLLSILIDPGRMAGTSAMAADIDRLVEWVKASPPARPRDEVLLPGEIERRTRDERRARGIPLDPNTLAQLRAAATSVGLADEAIERGLVEV